LRYATFATATAAGFPVPTVAAATAAVEKGAAFSLRFAGFLVLGLRRLLTQEQILISQGFQFLLKIVFGHAVINFEVRFKRDIVS